MCQICIFFSRSISPTLERSGIHEGPRARALQLSSDPLLEPIVASNASADNDIVIYSKASTLLRMLEAVMQVSACVPKMHFTPCPDAS